MHDLQDHHHPHHRSARRRDHGAHHGRLSLPGQRLTPGQALATDLLNTCTHRASDVRYWHGKDRALEFVESCLNPEGNGYAVNAYVRDQARHVLGLPQVETPKGPA